MASEHDFTFKVLGRSISILLSLASLRIYSLKSRLNQSTTPASPSSHRGLSSYFSHTFYLLLFQMKVQIKEVATDKDPNAAIHLKEPTSHHSHNNTANYRPYLGCIVGIVFVVFSSPINSPYVRHSGLGSCRSHLHASRNVIGSEFTAQPSREYMYQTCI